MSRDHLILSKFLLKNFSAERYENYPIYRLTIDTSTIDYTDCEVANTLFNFYDDDNEASFSKLESKFSDLCRYIVNKIDNNDEDLAKRLNSAKKLIKDWVKISYGRMFFNNPLNISISKNHSYDYRKRNEIIKGIRKLELPSIAGDFVDSAYVTLLRNSTTSGFVLGACNWIENIIEGYGVVLFPITPKLALCLIEKQWRTDKKKLIKKNDIAYLGYSNSEHVNAFNKVVFERTKEAGLNEIYSATKEELDYLITYNSG